MEQEEGSGFSPIFGAHNSVLGQGKRAQRRSKKLHKLRKNGAQNRDQTLGQIQPISVQAQGNFLTLISFISMLKFEANLSELMLSHV